MGEQHFSSYADFCFTKSILCGIGILRAADARTCPSFSIIVCIRRAALTSAIKTQVFTLASLASVIGTGLAAVVDIMILWTFPACSIAQNILIGTTGVSTAALAVGLHSCIPWAEITPSISSEVFALGAGFGNA
jgi:hypothetical protein